MSKKTYMILDLTVLTLVTAIAECIDIYVFKTFGNQVYALSIACVMGMIAIYRWNFYGLVVPVIAGACSVLTRQLMGGDVSLGLWLAYTVGYLGLSICLLWFLRKDKATLNDDLGFKLGYYFSGYAAVEILRAICQIGNGDFWKIALSYFGLDLLNVLFGLFVFFIACKQDNFVVDMNDYLHKIHDIPSSAAIRNEKRNAIKLEEMSDATDVNDAALLDGGTLSADDLRAMNEPLRRAEHKKSRFTEQQEAVERYHQDSKNHKKEKSGENL